ncbi:RNA polymerase sigma factor [Paraflavitalea soli]|nr:sigma-70 family RNA polymerase sigma factor [Paraflavitalea soli]
MRKATLGDDEARSMLYEQFAQKMFSICVRMTGNRPDAEDILQESFITAFNSLHQLREQHLFEPWLRRIIVTECIRHVKKVVRWQPVEEEFMNFPNAETDNWLQGISFEQIHQEIKALPGGCREVFNLYVIENYSHQQIADALEITLSTSKSQYHRARQLLKERLLKQLVRHG